MYIYIDVYIYTIYTHIYILYIYIYTIYIYIYSCPDIFYFHAGISISSEGIGLILNER